MGSFFIFLILTLGPYSVQNRTFLNFWLYFFLFKWLKKSNHLFGFFISIPIFFSVEISVIFIHMFHHENRHSKVWFLLVNLICMKTTCCIETLLFSIIVRLCMRTLFLFYFLLIFPKVIVISFSILLTYKADWC